MPMYLPPKLSVKKQTALSTMRTRLPPLFDAPSNDVDEHTDDAGDHSPTRFVLPALMIKRLERAPEPDPHEVRQEVERNFVAPEHADAILEASRRGAFAVGFRAVGPATIQALQRWAAAKGHDILEKTIKVSSIAKAYGEAAEEKMAMVRSAGIEGYRVLWN